jgi:pimeloyl-ACP methyl ester carboxylesterase
MESETLGAALKVIAAVVIGVPLLVFLLQERLIFMPRPLSDAERQDVGLRFPKGQNVFAQAADGIKLHAWHLPDPSGAPLVIYFGGNAEEVSWMLGEANSAVILVTPFDSMVEVGKRHYPYLPVSLLLKHRFDSVSRAPKITTALLCLVATRDSIIPVEHAKLLYDAWAGPKRWVPLEEVGHNTVDEHPNYWRSINAFLSERSS